MADLAPILVPVLLFGMVAALVVLVSRHLALAWTIQRRLPAPVRAAEASTGAAPRGFEAVVTRYFDEKRFGIVGAQRDKLKRSLLRAGFFAPHAINGYIF